MEGDTRLTHKSDLNRQPMGQFNTTKSYQSVPMSRSLPNTRLDIGSPRQGDIWRSTQSLSGRASVMTYQHKQYPSASAALSDYISDYESMKSSQDSQSQTSRYRRTVSDLLLPKTMLQKTVKRSLETGVRDTKEELHRFNIRKLIDDSYEQIMRADLEQGKASAIIATSRQLGSESTLSFDDLATQERLSDLASKISSSTDALLSAKPYIVNPRQRDINARKHGISSLRRSKSIDSVHLPVSCGDTEQKHLTVDRMNVSSRRGRPTRNHLNQRQYASVDSTILMQNSSRGVPSPKISQSRRSVPPSSDRRPIPAWVSNLDNSLASQKRLDSLYVDSLLTMDGHGPTHQESLNQNESGNTSRMLADLGHRMHAQSLQGPSEERAMSVMSAKRPPPTWVEDLDITTDNLPGSLRLLGNSMKTNHATKHHSISSKDNHITKQTRNFILPERKEMSKLASNRSEFAHPRTMSQHTSAKLIYNNGDITGRNVRRGLSSSNVDFTKDQTLRQRLHRRTHSASTEDLINESPYGDAVSILPSKTNQHHLHLLRQSKAEPKFNIPGKSSRTTRSLTSSHTNLPPSKTDTQLNLPKSLKAVSNSHVKHSRKSDLDDSVTTESLVYSSPFGLDRDMPFPDLSALPLAYAKTNELSPIGSSKTNGTLREDELASTLSSVSTMTLNTEDLTDGKSAMPHLIADHVSESTVGETARANAMLRRANRIMENTSASLNMSCLLEQQAHTPESSDTEELLAGDQEFMMAVKKGKKIDEETHRDPVTQKILDQFLDDCIQSSGKVSPDDSEKQASEGPLESLKNMLFKLQDLASPHDVELGGVNKSHEHKLTQLHGHSKKLSRHSMSSTNEKRHIPSPINTMQPSSSSPSSKSSAIRGSKGTTPSSKSQSKNVSFQSQRDFAEEPGGKSLQRAMKHLSRLKTLVAIETPPSSSAAS